MGDDGAYAWQCNHNHVDDFSVDSNATCFYAIVFGMGIDFCGLCVVQKQTSFGAMSTNQILDFLQGPKMNISDLQRLWQKLKLAGTASSQAELAIGILGSLDGRGGPFKLLDKMRVTHLRFFMEQHWEEIRKLNDPAGSGYDENYARYTKHNCMLFILWAWAYQK